MQLRTLIRPELRPNTHVAPEPPFYLWIHPDGTVDYDEECITEAAAKHTVDVWLSNQRKGKLMVN